MSDTIRNEEKHIWRERLTSEVSCFNADLSAFTLRILNALEQAEANVARLNKERDWLADKAADICASVYQESFDMHWWNPVDWKEAARRAVADSEVKG